jgi:hypothetical protein
MHIIRDRDAGVIASAQQQLPYQYRSGPVVGLQVSGSGAGCR